MPDPSASDNAPHDEPPLPDGDAAELALLAAHVPPHPGRPLAWALLAVAVGAAALVAARTFELLYWVPIARLPTVVAWGATCALAVACAAVTARRAQSVRGVALAMIACGAALGVVHTLLCEGATASSAGAWLANVARLSRAPRELLRLTGGWGLALGAMLAPPVAAAVVARVAQSAEATNALRLLTGAWLLLEGWLVAAYLAHSPLWALPAVAVATGAAYVVLAWRADARGRDPAEISREPPLAAAFRARRRPIALAVLVAGLLVAPLVALARAPRHAPRAVRVAYRGASATPYAGYAVPGVALWRVVPAELGDDAPRLVGVDGAGRLVRGAQLFARVGRPAPLQHARLAAGILLDDLDATVLLPGPRAPDMDPAVAALVTPPAVQGDTLTFCLDREVRPADGARFRLIAKYWVDVTTGEVLRMEDPHGSGFVRRHDRQPVRGFDDRQRTPD